MSKTSKFVLFGIIGFFLLFLLIIGAILGYELTLTGDQTEFIYNAIKADVKHKYYIYEVNKPTKESTEDGVWLEVDGIPIDIEKIQNNEVPMQKYSQLVFELNSEFANNSKCFLVDFGFYVWIDFEKGEERTLDFILEYGDQISQASVEIMYDAENDNGRGVVKFIGLYTEMTDIDTLVVKLDCTELNNDNCIEWTFTDMQISYNIEKQKEK